jgi:hypothetical protein
MSDTRGSITQFLGPVKLVKKVAAEDANPEGVNQYSSAAKAAFAASAKANEITRNAERVAKISRGYGTVIKDAENTARKDHEAAASAHRGADRTEGVSKADRAMHQDIAKEHGRMAINHAGRFDALNE